MIRCGIHGLGVLTPGLLDWESAQPVLSGQRAWENLDPGRIVAPDLPRTEARRATVATHLALSVARQAMTGHEPSDDEMPSIWAAADSDLVGLDRNCRTLNCDEPWISPHRFQNSVHNTPSGYWSIASQCHGPSTALCSGRESFAAGLVEAVTLLQAGHERCLLVACDEASPPALRRVRDVPVFFATSLLLGVDGSSAMSLTLDIQGGATEPTICSDPGLERLRASNPAGRSLPLLCSLAAGDDRPVRLAWNGSTIELRVENAA